MFAGISRIGLRIGVRNNKVSSNLSSLHSLINFTKFEKFQHVENLKNLHIQAQKRNFQTSSIALHGHLKKPNPGEELHVTFILKDGEQKTFEVAEGDNLLDIAQAHHLDVEGACGGSCACSTCHVIVDPDYYDLIPEPDDDENDMLDLAYGLTETSRLGCQVVMTPELDGIRVALPTMTRNLMNKDMN